MGSEILGALNLTAGNNESETNDALNLTILFIQPRWRAEGCAYAIILPVYRLVPPLCLN